MENSRLRRAAPTSVNVTVSQRSREYLTDREVARLIEAAKQNRSGAVSDQDSRGGRLFGSGHSDAHSCDSDLNKIFAGEICA
jgi:hypothetical protein